MIAILDLISMGYYKIKQGILQQNLSKYYKFESDNTICEHVNRFINMLKKEQKEMQEKYSWLDPGNERKYMRDKEILDKYIHLDKSCLTDVEKIQFMDMLYKYKDALHLRDEIGTCPNIEVQIDVTDKSPFFIRPYHVREKDNTFIKR